MNRLAKKENRIGNYFMLLLLLLYGVMTQAQQFGGNPPSVKWKQMDTDTARVIFPVGMDSTANRLASVVHYLAASQTFSTSTSVKKISIILQTQTVIPNGYVALGPWKSEFFMTAEMNSMQGSVPWPDQLALHEYRHVQQISHFNHGLSRFMKVISGEQGYDLAINASVPNWFYEGDAVYAETVFSNQGRGRLPYFMNAYPSLWRAGKNYSWMKLRNGSLKDYVPNHYYLGYLLVQYGREQYGADFWPEVTKDASSFKSMIYPFQSAIRRKTGKRYKTFTSEALQSWQQRTTTIQKKEEAFLFPVNQKVVTHYQFPYLLTGDSILYLKISYRQRPAFYIKDKKGEHRLRFRDISVDEQFSYRNGKIVYAAYESDPRWGWKDYSVIRVLDVETGQQRTLSPKTKYFSPDISDDGSKITVVQAEESGNTALLVLDALDGTVLHSIRAAEVLVFSDPKFTEEGKIVAAARFTDGRMSLVMADPATGTFHRLTPPSYHVVGYPCVSNSSVYFTASYHGNDDVYMLRLSDKKIFRVSDGPQGRYFVHTAHRQLIWSAFTAEGYQLQQSGLDLAAAAEMDSALLTRLPAPYGINPQPVSGDILLTDVPVRKFATQPYKKGTRLFNFHSWRPYYSDPYFTYSLYGENVLNTLQTELYYLYNQNEQTSAAGFSGTYGAWFPWMSAGTEYTFNRTATMGNKVRRWNQLDTRAGLTVPLNYAAGRSYRSLNLGSFYVLRNEWNQGFFKDSLGNTSLSYLLHTFSWTQQVPKAAQDIYPRFAYSISFNHRHAISRVSGYQFIGSTICYVPGIVPTHHFSLSGSFQQRDTLSQVIFSDRFAYARGYTGKYFSRMWRVSANYHLPLAYPDFGFANILYLLRIRAAGFFDYTKVYSRDKRQTRMQRCTGAELFFDTKWWNQYPLSFGCRLSFLMDPDQYDGRKGTRFEIILPVSIIPR